MKKTSGFFKTQKGQETVVAAEKMAQWLRVNPVLPSLLPGTHAVWLTTAWNSSSRRSDASGFHGSGTHVHIPLTVQSHQSSYSILEHAASLSQIVTAA